MMKPTDEITRDDEVERVILRHENFGYFGAYGFKDSRAVDAKYMRRDEVAEILDEDGLFRAWDRESVEVIPVVVACQFIVEVDGDRVRDLS